MTTINQKNTNTNMIKTAVVLVLKASLAAHLQGNTWLEMILHPQMKI
jgi:hypothetical protein